MKLKRIISMLLVFVILIGVNPGTERQTYAQDVNKCLIKELTIIDADDDSQIIKDELTFTFKNLNNPDEKEEEYRTVDGKLIDVKINKDDIYLLKLKENGIYDMKEIQLFGFMNGSPMYASTYDSDERMFDKIGVTHKNSQEKRIFIKIMEDKDLTSNRSLEFFCMDQYGKKQTSVVGSEINDGLINPAGYISFKLKEDCEYTIGLLDNEDYIVEESKVVLIKENSSYQIIDKYSKDLLNEINLKNKENHIEEKNAIRYILNLNCDKGSLEDKELKFKLTDERGHTVTSFNGEEVKDNSFFNPIIKNDQISFKFLEDIKYTISLEDNIHYKMEDIEVIYNKNLENFKENPYPNLHLYGTNEIIKELKLLQKSDIDKNKNNYIRKILQINADGYNLKDVELKFVLVDSLGRKQTSVTGSKIKEKLKLNYDEIAFKFLEDQEYTLKLETNKYFEMEDLEVAFKSNPAYGEGAFPELYKKDSFEIIDKIGIEAKPYIDLIKNNTTEKINKFKMITYVLHDGYVVEPGFEFELLGKDSNRVIKNDEGEIVFDVNVDEIYTIKLKKNDIYNMEDIIFSIHYEDGLYIPTIENPKEGQNPLFVSLDLRRIDGKDNPNQGKEKVIDDDKNDSGCVDKGYIENTEVVKIPQIRIVKCDDINANPKFYVPVTEKLIFKLFNSSKQRFEGEYESEKGLIPPMELIKDDNYILSIKNNSKYSMSNSYIKAFKNGRYPNKIKQDGTLIQVVLKDKDKDDFVNGKVPTTIYLNYKDQPVDQVEMMFVSEFETVKAISINGKIDVDLLEDVTYSVIVNSNSYDVDLFPLVIKDKSEYGVEYGKYPYNHSSCNYVHEIELLDKGQANKDGFLKCSSGKTKIYGMNFNNYILHVVKKEDIKIKSLKNKDIDVFEIKLINPFRSEVSKIAMGDFKIERQLDNNKKIKAVHELNNDGSTRELKFTVDNSKVNIFTNSLSINPIILEYEEKSDKLNEQKFTDNSNSNVILPRTKPIEKPVEKPVEKSIKKFNDISKDFWGYEVIERLQVKGLIKGYEDGNLRPYKKISRAELVSLIDSAFDLKESKGNISFKDLSTDDWYFDSVKKLAEAGLIKGYKDGTFKGNKEVTREELITILVRLVEHIENRELKQSKANFKDISEASDWSLIYIGKAKEEAIINGYEDNSIKSKNSASRIEAFTIIYKILKLK